VNQSLLQERLVAWLSTFFASPAVLLACIGVYGLLAVACIRLARSLLYGVGPTDPAMLAGSAVAVVVVAGVAGAIPTSRAAAIDPAAALRAE
jgi:ABC-type antimicrobial peptide transport system permease subunit